MKIYENIDNNGFSKINFCCESISKVILGTKVIIIRKDHCTELNKVLFNDIGIYYCPFCGEEIETIETAPF